MKTLMSFSQECKVYASLLLIIFFFSVLTSTAHAVERNDAQEHAREAHSERFYMRDMTVRGARGDARADEIIVKFKGDERFKRVRVEDGRAVSDTIAEYQRREDIEYAEPNYIAYAFSVPNDPLYTYQWHLDNSVHGGIGYEEARDIENGAGVIVAVIDTGIAYEDWVDSGKTYSRAPDLANTSFAPGYDFVNNDTHPNDDEGHGTHVAGTVAQSTNNALGVAGVAPGATLMPIKVLDQNGSGSYADVAEGIRWAADHGAKVINLSLGGSSPASYLEDALAYAYGQGVTIVAAAGNNGLGVVGYPAAYDAYVIAVGATRYDEAKTSYSNYGSSLDVVAPGGDSSVDQNGDGYGDGVLQQTFGSSPNIFGYYFYNGTSMATPHVAGVAALVIAQGSAVAPDSVRERIQSTARDLGTSGKDMFFGYGIVDAFAALGGEPPPPPPPIIVHEIFKDSFENGIVGWIQDSQQDWYSSAQRATDGILSLEVDGMAKNASITSTPITLDATSTVTVSFSWLIERSLDRNEYIAFDISTDGGTTWTERARLRGNVDPEDSWRTVSLSLSSISNLRLRFRGTMSDGSEDANVDNILVTTQ